MGTDAVLGIGLISASMFMLMKGFNAPSRGWSGYCRDSAPERTFPVSELPGPRYLLAQGLPQTYTIDTIRRLLPQDEPAAPIQIGSLSSPASGILIVAMMTAGAIVLGAIAFRLGIQKAQRDGGYFRWS